MGIKLINTFASAALVLSFCGALGVSVFAQDQNNTKAVVKTGNVSMKANPFDKFGKGEKTVEKTKEKQSSSSSSHSWTGWYVGGFVGSNFSRGSADVSTVFAPTGYFATSSVNAVNGAGATRVKKNGFTGGGQGGYNYQTGNFLVGFEADFGSNRAQMFSFSNTTYPCCSPDSFLITQSVGTEWMFTARPRAGVVHKNALFYVTGGLAVTDVEYGSVFSDNFANALETNFFGKTKVGWTGGGGVEVKLAKRWSAKAEYLYANFGRTSSTSTNLTAFTPTQSFPENVFTHSAYLKNHNLRFGINFHF
ncbi:MAG TPA: outer membrane beta-barrel protein [Pyrinomonadaceae bacterium]|jgi:outer membrane immunogenic protein|nr:outer membrane beta-barrel protein [Pyrinomonadaceae bacterium]